MIFKRKMMRGYTSYTQDSHMILSALIDADSERQKVVASSQLKKKSFFVAEVALRLRRYFHF